MFGSNYPMLTPGDCLEQLDDLGLDEETAECFLWRNASEVFGIEKEAAAPAQPVSEGGPAPTEAPAS